MDNSKLTIGMLTKFTVLALIFPATVFAAASSSDIGSNGQFARPFYIVGHNPNTFVGSFDPYVDVSRRTW